MLIGVWTYKKISVMVDVTPKILERKDCFMKSGKAGLPFFQIQLCAWC